MLSVTNKAGPFVAPQTDNNPAFVDAEKTRNGKKESFNFESVLGESNTLIAEQLEKDKQALGENGEIRVGESKNDREFREMLERVSGKKQEAAKNKLNKDDYLNLMVTQLKYQDPTKPLENHEMATQLAQFNTVEQLIGVNKTLQSMQNQSAQANIDKLTPYLGRLVEVNGAKIRVGEDMKVTQGAVDLAAKAGSVSILIKDNSGNIVRTIGLGEKGAGRHTVEWDGKTDAGANAKPGDYTFEVQASAQDGKQMQVKTSFTAKVEAITDLANGGRLDTPTGKVEAKDILAIRPDHHPVAAAAAAAAAPAAPAAPAAAAAAPAAKRERPRPEQKPQAEKSALAGNNAPRAEKTDSRKSEAKATDVTPVESKATNVKAPETKAIETKQTASGDARKAS
jgi:flagellar basal-body rod modification protein FlgD